MKYRLVALDLDGTLLDSRLRIRRQTIDALNRVREQGVQAMIVTGRHHVAAYPYWHELGLELPAICCNGTYVYDFRARRPLVGNPLTRQEGRELLALTRRHDVHTMIYIDEVMAYETVGPHLINLLGWSDTLAEEIRPRIERVDSFERIVEEENTLWKFLVSGKDTGRLQAFDAEVERRLGLSCVWSADNRIDITRSGNSKGQRLSEWIAGQGILPGEVIAFGDQDNDREMLAMAGFGVAMGNCRPELREFADWVTGTNDTDAIAETLDRFVLTAA